MMARHGETRQRMLDSSVAVMREHGAAGLSIDEVLARSGAPRGSVYHHFPGGRQALISETLEYAGDSYSGMLTRAAERGPEALIRRLVTFWTKVLKESNFREGCPVVATAMNPGIDAEGLAVRAAEIFQGWRATVAATFQHAGVPVDQADTLATTCLAALDGAVSLSRTTRSLKPLQDVASGLGRLLELSSTNTAPTGDAVPEARATTASEPRLDRRNK